MAGMSDITRLLTAIHEGDQNAMAQLLPVVYDELRRLARLHMFSERKDHTLQATALVHEAYLRLLGDISAPWDGRRHFFAAAAEAMRRILIEHARAKNAIKRGGQLERVDLDELPPMILPSQHVDDLLALDDALTSLEAEAPAKAQLVKLRFFAGLTMEEAAEAMGISERTAKRHWVYAKAWLFDDLKAAD